MPKVGRPPVLDDAKRREILAILSVGCSRRSAAQYVGCSPKTIQNTAERDPEFAQRLQHAGQASEIEFLRSIKKAAKKEQYWRAAAWALERLNPEDFAKRPVGTLTLEQVRVLLIQLAEIVLQEVPVADYRKSAIKSVDRLLARIRPDLPVRPAETERDDGA